MREKDARIPLKAVAPKVDDPDWFVRSARRHFDNFLGPSKSKELVTNPDSVTRHSFYPFIQFRLTSRRFSRTQGAVKRIEDKVREICIPSHADGQIYSYYSKLIGTRYESYIEGHAAYASAVAYRKIDGKCNIHFAHEAFKEILQRGNCNAFTFDVRDFFGSISHIVLKKKWAQILNVPKLPDDHYSVFRSMSRYSFVEMEDLKAALGICSNAQFLKLRGRICDPLTFRESIRGGRLIQVNDNGRGIPQGAPLSATLSNVYMIDFDAHIAAWCSKNDSFYRRYSDDILIITPPGYCRKQVEELLTAEIQELGLSLNTSKTTESSFSSDGYLVTVDKPLQYLGFQFNGKQIFVRSSSFSRYVRKLRRRIRLFERSARKRKMTRLNRQKLYALYTHLGRRNFIAYARRAARIMGSKSLRQQAARHWRLIERWISQAEIRLVGYAYAGSDHSAPSM